MGAVILDEGRDYTARVLVAGQAAPLITFRLWASSTGGLLLPSYSLSDFTGVGSPGYADWTTAVADWSGAAGLYQTGIHDFLFGASAGPAQTVNGYVAYDLTTLTAFFAELFPLPWIVPVGGGVLPFVGSWGFIA